MCGQWARWGGLPPRQQDILACLDGALLCGRHEILRFGRTPRSRRSGYRSLPGLSKPLLTSRMRVFIFITSQRATIRPFQGSENARRSDSFSGRPDGSGRGCGIASAAELRRVGKRRSGKGPDYYLSRRPPCTRTGATRTGKPVARPRSPSVLPRNKDEWSLGSAIRGGWFCLSG